MPTCPHNMVNFYPLAADICWRVWSTPANFNGFRVLAALLHGTLVVGVSQTLPRWTDGATYIRQGGHHVGHWPHSSWTFFASSYCWDVTGGNLSKTWWFGKSLDSVCDYILILYGNDQLNDYRSDYKFSPIWDRRHGKSTANDVATGCPYQLVQKICRLCLTARRRNMRLFELFELWLGKPSFEVAPSTSATCSCI